MIVIFIGWPAVLVGGAIIAVRGGDTEHTRAPLRRAPRQDPPATAARWPNPSWMPPEDDEELLCRMIRLRLKKDSRLSGQGPPHRWPPETLWQTTEAVLLDAVRAYCTLHQDGLPPSAICERIIERQGGVGDHKPPSGLRSMVRARLRHDDPAYLALGAAVLGPATGLAMRFVRKQFDQRQHAADTPRPDWLRESLSPEEVERDFEGLIFPDQETPADWRMRLAEKRREWALLALRMGVDDAIWRYQAPDDSGGARGLALVRAGQPVDYVAAAGRDDSDPETSHASNEPPCPG